MISHDNANSAFFRIARLVDIEQIEVVGIEPSLPAVGEVRIRVACTGICGSDLSTWQGRHPYKRAPTVLGHEFSGVIDTLGPGVTTWRNGDRVCAMAYAPCGTCKQCDGGRPQLCRNSKTFSHQGWDGSFATFVHAPESILFALPDNVDDESGALIEPMAIGLHAIRLAGDVSGQSVAVIGAGNIGLTCTLASKMLLAGTVTCIDINPLKEKLAHGCGADRFIRAPIEDLDCSFDVVVVACDYPTALEDAARLVVDRGLIVVVSYFGAACHFQANTLVRREVRMIGSALADPGDFTTVIGWIADKKLNVRPMITHVLDLGDAAIAMRLMAKQTDCVGKIILVP